ncbi:MAG: sigma-54-dependent Fis family transcriptional regulator [Proteobacteria bacterium]|nr:sigma-54-dependent Fis family transcriptional regulator [Pseudomonadota bacterium]
MPWNRKDGPVPEKLNSRKELLMLETQFPIQSDLIEKAAQTEQGVLIFGENGTGKELIARIIHNRSSRSNGNFIVMSCSLSGEILETEFQSKMEAANGGTIFLEEINELPLHLQARLLQNHGGVRIIASTSANIQEAVAEKLFRSDLLAKLSYVSFSIPALRERVEQIPTLVAAYIEKYNRLTGSNVASTPSPEAIDALTSYAWPGNVRELEHVIERIVIVKGQGVVDASDLPAKISQAVQNASGATFGEVDFPKMFLSEKGVDLKAVVTAFENHLVDQALARTSGNKNRASMLLGLNRTTLVEKLRKRGMITPLKSNSDFRGPMSGSNE